MKAPGLAFRYFHVVRRLSFNGKMICKLTLTNCQPATSRLAFGHVMEF